MPSAATPRDRAVVLRCVPEAEFGPLKVVGSAPSSRSASAQTDRAVRGCLQHDKSSPSRGAKDRLHESTGDCGARLLPARSQGPLVSLLALPYDYRFWRIRNRSLGMLLRSFALIQRLRQAHSANRQERRGDRVYESEPERRVRPIFGRCQSLIVQVATTTRRHSQYRGTRQWTLHGPYGRTTPEHGHTPERSSETNRRATKGDAGNCHTLAISLDRFRSIRFRREAGTAFPSHELQHGWPKDLPGFVPLRPGRSVLRSRSRLLLPSRMLSTRAESRSRALPGPRPA